MKNISIFMYDLNLGGTEKVMVNLANYLTAQGFIITILLVADNRYLEKELLPQIKVVSFKRKRIFQSFIPLICYIYSNKIDVLIANVWPLTIVAIAAGFSRPGFNRKALLVEHCHLEREFSDHSSVFKFFQKLSIKYFYPKSFKVIGVSDGVRDDLHQTKGLKATHITVIENPVDIKINLKLNRPRLLSKWANFEGAKLISVGNLKFQKNYPYLISSLAALKADNFLFKQLIVGEGPERRKIEHLIKHYHLEDDVILAGLLDAPIDLMGAADLFILPSRFEGFGLVIVEALAAGTTVVATDCESGPRAILKDGALGFLAAVNNEHNFCQQILHAYKNQLPANLLIERAKDYSIDLIGPKYESLINSVK